MIETHQVLAYMDVVNLITDYIRRKERNADVLLDIKLAVSTRKTMYLEVGRHRDMMENEHITFGNN